MRHAGPNPRPSGPKRLAKRNARACCCAFSGLWGDRHIRNGDGFICVYSVTSRESYNQLGNFRDQILQAKDVSKVGCCVTWPSVRALRELTRPRALWPLPPQCPMIVVGNKCDLVDMREVTEADGRDLAAKSNAQFLETRYVAVEHQAKKRRGPAERGCARARRERGCAHEAGAGLRAREAGSDRAGLRARERRDRAPGSAAPFMRAWSSAGPVCESFLRGRKRVTHRDATSRRSQCQDTRQH